MFYFMNGENEKFIKRFINKGLCVRLPEPFLVLLYCNFSTPVVNMVLPLIDGTRKILMSFIKSFIYPTECTIKLL
jgi:hypothetical protein